MDASTKKTKRIVAMPPTATTASTSRQLHALWFIIMNASSPIQAAIVLYESGFAPRW